jgi:putative endonuclease
MSRPGGGRHPRERPGQRRAAWGRGRSAERIAAWWLRLKGYRILARGLRTPVGEIDLIARRGAVLAIVEVKARPDLDQAGGALLPRQQARIERAAAAFLQREPALAALDLRFDVVLVAPGRLPRHLPNAWRCGELRA